MHSSPRICYSVSVSLLPLLLIVLLFFFFFALVFLLQPLPRTIIRHNTKIYYSYLADILSAASHPPTAALTSRLFFCIKQLKAFYYYFINSPLSPSASVPQLHCGLKLCEPPTCLICSCPSSVQRKTEMLEGCQRSPVKTAQSPQIASSPLIWHGFGFLLSCRFWQGYRH